MVSEATVEFVVSSLATLTFLSTLFIFVFFASRLYKKKDLLAPFWEQPLLIAFIVALTATLGSLFLSEIAGYTPCKLCWLQRVFMYPQTVILGLAWWKKRKDVALYSMPLAAIGAIIATYHYYLQLFSQRIPLPFVGMIPCDPVSGPCTITYTFRFGYITIPMMALIAFILILIFVTRKR